jgi:hypothetical protein
MQSRVVVRPSRYLVAAVIGALALAMAGWCLKRHDDAQLTPLHQGMRYEELASLYGKHLWGVVLDRDLAYMARGLRFGSTPLVGDCLGARTKGRRAFVTADELPRILEPRTAPQVWLFRTGLVSGILVYPDRSYGAGCILYARPSGWSALLGF